MRFRVVCAIGVFGVTAFLPSGGWALTVTAEECGEGADFIRNAAFSRDNGMPAAAFLERLEGDLHAIRSYPVALRWFAKDADDEALLRIAATSVFDAPRGADDHHREFLAHCRELSAAAHMPRSDDALAVR
jgi:hypothetical protein